MRRHSIPLALIKRRYYGEGKSQQQIADELGVSQWVISDRMRKANLHILDRTRKLNPWKYKIDHHAFDSLNDKTAWLIGWMISDGFVSNNRRFGLKVSVVDKDIIEKFKEYLQYTGPIYKYERKLKQTSKAYHQVGIQPTSRRIVSQLAKFGVFPNKSLSVKLPDLIANKNEGIIRCFIRGAFEGDGSFFLDSRQSLLFQIVGTQELCRGIQRYLVKYIGVGVTKLTRNRKKSNHYALRYRGRIQALEIMDWLYQNAEPNVLDRKYNQYLSIREKFLCVE